MASSRIFVRGLPTSYTEDEFRNHFSKHYIVTDARLLPQRRIGYVGFKTPQDAYSAVRYFNKSFIRMSKIGVELAYDASQIIGLEPPFFMRTTLAYHLVCKLPRVSGNLKATTQHQTHPKEELY